MNCKQKLEITEVKIKVIKVVQSMKTINSFLNRKYNYPLRTKMYAMSLNNCKKRNNNEYQPSKDKKMTL